MYHNHKKKQYCNTRECLMLMKRFLGQYWENEMAPENFILLHKKVQHYIDREEFCFTKLMLTTLRAA